MRTRFIIYIMAAMTILGSLSHAEKMPLSGERYEAVISDFVLPFLRALKNGDVDLIKHYIAGDIYENKIILLEKNKGYPEFLRNYYRGVEFYIENAVQSGDYIVVNVVIEFSNGEEGNANLYLCKDMDFVPEEFEEAAWKIVGFRFINKQ
jgi:hypothetical protein